MFDIFHHDCTEKEIQILESERKTWDGIHPLSRDLRRFSFHHMGSMYLKVKVDGTDTKRQVSNGAL